MNHGEMLGQMNKRRQDPGLRSRFIRATILNVSVKAIDQANPGGANDDPLSRNVELTIVASLNLKESPSLASLLGS
jgi:hypothetical protein